LARATFLSDAASQPAFSTEDAQALDNLGFGTTQWVGTTLYDRYLVPFEMISLLIVAAIAAVIVLAKKNIADGDGPQRPAREPEGAGRH
ncbi:MAG TPA: NADH-quinone oxidoreductase subunit J, partial [Planctomycetota bacterium]|nr:NADH-quinone oxidoreductase subunit J [Planctomycetota bacterium]